MTYNDIQVPATIKTDRIISAFENVIENSKVEEYAEIMSNEMLSHNFPPIQGFPNIVSKEDIGEYFMAGGKVTRQDVGKLVWMVTDGHHRTLAAIQANLPYLEVTLDYSTITNEKDFAQFR